MNSRFSRNFAYNILGALLPIFVALVTVPLYIQMIGAGRYGIVSLTWILLGYFGFLDFGLSRASTNALGRLGHASAAERAPVIMTSLYLNLALGAAGSLVLYAAGAVLLHGSLRVPGELEQEMLAAFPWIVPMLPLGMINGVAMGALESRERFLLANVITSSGMVLGQTMPLVVTALFGPSLTVLIPTLLAVRLVVVIAVLGLVLRLEWPMRPFGFHMGWARKLFGYGLWVSVSSLLTPILDTFDQLLIGRLLGPVSIAHYAVPMNLSLRSQVIAGALARTMFPAISRANPAERRRMTAHATVALIYGFGAMCGPTILVARPFLTLWLGHDFAEYAIPVAEILMLGAWTNGIAFMPYNQLQAGGRPDLTAKVHAIEVIPFLLGLWGLISVAGLPGAALAWTLRVSADCVALTWLARCLEGSLLRALPALVLMLGAYGVAQAVAFSPAGSLLAGTLLGLVFLGLGVALEPVLRDTAAVLAGRFAVLTRRVHPAPARLD